jgi:hypothetical protein
MDERWYGPIELAFAFGVPLAWCFRELWLLRKLRLKREAERAAAGEGGPQETG